MTRPERIAAIRESIVIVEREQCRCVWTRGRLGDDGWDVPDELTHQCSRCRHLDDLDAQLREAEGQDA